MTRRGLSDGPFSAAATKWFWRCRVGSRRSFSNWDAKVDVPAESSGTSGLEAETAKRKCTGKDEVGRVFEAVVTKEANE